MHHDDTNDRTSAPGSGRARTRWTRTLGAAVAAGLARALGEWLLRTLTRD
ncbi:hypothetical protein ACWGR4_42395 [Embleya sp. NPDC055664]